MSKTGKHSVKKNFNIKLFFLFVLIVLLIVFILINTSILTNFIKPPNISKDTSDQISNLHSDIEILSFDVSPKKDSEYEVKIKIKNNSTKPKSPFILSVSLLDKHGNTIDTFENIISATEPGQEIFSTKLLPKDLSSYSTYKITKKNLTT